MTFPSKQTLWLAMHIFQDSFYHESHFANPTGWTRKHKFHLFWLSLIDVGFFCILANYSKVQPMGRLTMSLKQNQNHLDSHYRRSSVLAVF